VKRVDVTSAAEMNDAVMRALPVDVFVGVAAVADWRVANPSDRKIKRHARSKPPALQFEPNIDILAAVAALPTPPYCVGFAAESEDVVENAKRKLASKRVPLIVANRAQDAFGADGSELFLVDAAGVTPLPLDDKRAQARRLVAEIASRLRRG
jgi:phosphopantothenoylcysteine decarboxylase/phosphopantothenate--cysteine ligase